MDDTLTDKILTCCSCRATFVFEAGEQRFYQDKWLKDPRHCRPCREARRAKRQDERQQVAL